MTGIKDKENFIEKNKPQIFQNTGDPLVPMTIHTDADLSKDISEIDDPLETKKEAANFSKQALSFSDPNKVDLEQQY